MRRRLTMGGPLLALVAALLAAMPTVAADGVQLDVAYVEQGRAPWCAAAAAVMVAGFHGRPLKLKALVRQVPVHRDGIAWLDLIDALPGLDADVVTGTEADLKTALKAGHPPIALMKDGARTHAVVVTGWDAAGWSVLDPAAPGDRRYGTARFADAWSGGLVLLRPIHTDTALPLPLAEWRRQTDRFRAEGWVQRSREVPATDALVLLDRAAGFDPNHPAVDLQRAAVLGELKRGPEACAAVASARAKAPSVAAIEQVAMALGCPAP